MVTSQVVLLSKKTENNAVQAVYGLFSGCIVYSNERQIMFFSVAGESSRTPHTLLRTAGLPRSFEYYSHSGRIHDIQGDRSSVLLTIMTSLVRLTDKVASLY